MRVVLESPTAGALDTELRVGDPAATVADLLGELGVGEAFSGVVIDGRFCHRELALAEIGLYEGARVAPAQLAPPGDDGLGVLQLRVISGLEAGRRVPLTAAGVLVGRELHCDLVLEDDSVSRRHLRVVASAGGLQATLTDLESANGTWLEGRRISAPTEVAVGAIFEAGDVAFTLAAPAPGLALDPLRKPVPRERSRSTGRRARARSRPGLPCTRPSARPTRPRRASAGPRRSGR